MQGLDGRGSFSWILFDCLELVGQCCQFGSLSVDGLVCPETNVASHPVQAESEDGVHAGYVFEKNWEQTVTDGKEAIKRYWRINLTQR